MTATRRTIPILAVALVIASLASPGAPRSSLAGFTDVSTATAGFASGSLAPPTGLAVTATLDLAATLSWTMAPEAYATGYMVYRSSTSGSGYVQVAVIGARTTTSAVDIPALPGTYHYVVRTVAGGWQSGLSNEVSVLLL